MNLLTEMMELINKGDFQLEDEFCERDGAVCSWILRNGKMFDEGTAKTDEDGFIYVSHEYSIRFNNSDIGPYHVSEFKYAFILAAGKMYDFMAGHAGAAETGKPEDAKQYTSLGIEPIEIMRKNFTKEEFIGFLKGNVVKYTFRKKGQDESDLNKLVTYTKWLRAAEHDKPIQIGSKTIAPKEE